MASIKYVFVTGGVTSSLGKGIIAASLAKLLQARGFSVTIQKFDPYINIDPGTMNPYEHGECYVTNDGAETDLDLGHYERFLNVSTSQANNVTTGRIYNNVITKERRGDYLGKTVQVVPHITDEIKYNFFKLGETGKYDIVITELGGCVGDIESLPFIEAVRQTRLDLNPEDTVVLHLTLVPYLEKAKELKTKPTQHSVKLLLEAGADREVRLSRSGFTAWFFAAREGRGDVIEIWPAYEKFAVRVDMFGDEVERIELINPTSGEVLAEESQFFLFPAVHYVVPEEILSAALTSSVERGRSSALAWMVSRRQMPA